MKKILSLAFFISGISAIIYETLWVRILSLAFGGVTLVVASVTAAFLAGLALGAFFGGGLVDKIARRTFKAVFIFYGLLEILIIFLGLISWWFFNYLTLNDFSGREIMAFSLLLGQSSLMGATWPVMFKLFLGLGSDWQAGGKITFLNTLGGALGALLSTYFLIANLGIWVTFLLSITGSFLAGFMVLSQFLAGPKLARLENQEKISPVINQPKISFFILMLLALAGFLGMAMEIFWLRAFGLLVGSSLYAFSLVLTVILLGLALGGLLVNLIGKKISLTKFVWLMFFWSFSVLLGQFVLAKSPAMIISQVATTGWSFISSQFLSLSLALVVVFPSSFISGLVLPQGLVLLKGIFPQAGLKGGWAYFLNTAGSVLGGLLAALLFLPFLGLKIGILFLAGLAGVIFLLTIFLLRINRLVATLAIILIIIGGGLIVFKSWDEQKISSGAWLYGLSMLGDEAGVKLLSYKDGREATVSTIWQNGATALQVNGKIDASSEGDIGTEAILGHVPVLLHEDPRNVLVIGLGSGITSGAIAQHQRVEKITTVEIEPEVVEAARKYFAKENFEVLDNPKMKTVIGDGRNFLLKTQEKFDVITSEPSNPWIAGEANLFTKEYFEIGKERLTEDGVFFQWLQIYNIRPAEIKSIIATFHSVFPYVQIWTSTNPVDIFLAGKANKHFNLSWDRFEEALAVPGVRESLKRRGFDDEIRLFSLIWARTALVDKIAQGGEINTDQKPILAFRAPLGLFEDHLVENYEMLLEFFQGDSTSLDIASMPQDMTDEIVAARQARHFLIQAKLAEVKGNLEEAVSLIEKGLRIDDKAPTLRRTAADLSIKLARQKLNERKAEEGQQLLTRAKEQDPNNYLAWKELGNWYLVNAQKQTGWDKEFLKKAQGELLVVAEKADWDFTNHVNLGIIAAVWGDLARAEQEFKKSIEIFPKNIMAWNNLAQVYWDQGREGEARKTWQESLEINHNQPEIEMKLAVMQNL